MLDELLPGRSQNLFLGLENTLPDKTRHKMLADTSGNVILSQWCNRFFRDLGYFVEIGGRCVAGVLSFYCS